MWAYFVKDLKENARWGLLAALALTALVGYLLGSKPGQSDPSGGLSVVGETYQSGVQIGMAAAGLSLGLALALADARRGHWGFAVHRPISRMRIFFAKLAAGLTLYAVASGVAVGVAALLAMSPHIVQTPFDPSMMVPTAYYQLAGAMWLVTGMLVGRRNARWFGSRLLPVATAATAAAFGSDHGTTAAEAFAVVGVAFVSLTLAAALAFSRNGDDDAPPWARPLQAAALGVGVLFLLGMTAGFATSVVASLTGGYRYATSYDFYLLGVDRQPYRTSLDNNARTVFDARGHRLTPEQQAWFMKTAPDTASLLSGDPLDPRLSREFRPSFLWSGSYLQVLGGGNGNDKSRWFFVPGRRTMEALIAFGPDAGRASGSLGPGGFRPEEQTPEPFGACPIVRSNDLVGAATIVFAGPKVYLLDRAQRTTRVVLEVESPDRVFDTTLVLPDHATKAVDMLAELTRPLDLVAVTRGALHVVSLTGGTATRVPLDTEDWREHIDVLMPDARTVVALTRGGSPRRFGPVQVILFHDNREVSRVDLPVLPTPFMGPGRAGLLKAALLPPAVTARYAYWVWPDEMAQSVPPPGYRIVAAAVAVASALATMVLARRRRLNGRTTAAWAVAGLVLGLAAPLTMACLYRRWPRVRCPACGKPRVVDRDECEHCGAAFPPPGDAATAVFEDAGRAVA